MSFFRIKLGEIKTADNSAHKGAAVPVWVCDFAPLTITPDRKEAFALCEAQAKREIEILRERFPEATLEPATYAEWIDQGGPGDLSSQNGSDEPRPLG